MGGFEPEWCFSAGAGSGDGVPSRRENTEAPLPGTGETEDGASPVSPLGFLSLREFFAFAVCGALFPGAGELLAEFCR